MAELKKGAKGKEVTQLQKDLNKAGAKPKLAEDGIFGAKTQTAVQAYQKKNKLKVTGTLNDETRASIKAGGPLPELPAIVANRVRQPSVPLFERYDEISITAGQIELVDKDLQALATAVSAFVKKSLADDKKIQGMLTDRDISVRQLQDIAHDFERTRIKDPKSAAKMVKNAEAIEKSLTALEKKLAPLVTTSITTTSTMAKKIDTIAAKLAKIKD